MLSSFKAIMKFYKITINILQFHHQAAKKQPGSGRLHRTLTGEWVWSSEEEDGGKGSDDEEVSISSRSHFFDLYGESQESMWYSGLVLGYSTKRYLV